MSANGIGVGVGVAVGIGVGVGERWRAHRTIGAAVRTALLALLAVSVTSCDSWFYYPTRVERVIETPGLDISALRFSSTDGAAIDGRWITAHGESRGTIVYCHGYDKNLTHHLKQVLWLADAGFNLLAFDYRGFGRSTGRPTRRGTIEDTVAAIDVALARDPRRTVVYGHSLGGAVGIVAAARRPAVRAVIAESTFPTYRAAARARVPLLAFLMPLLVSAELDPVAALSALPPRPILVTHGAADDAVPAALGRELFAHAADPKQLWIIEGGSHRAPWGDRRREYQTRITDFLRATITP